MHGKKKGYFYQLLSFLKTYIFLENHFNLSRNVLHLHPKELGHQKHVSKPRQLNIPFSYFVNYLLVIISLYCTYVIKMFFKLVVKQTFLFILNKYDCGYFI